MSQNIKDSALDALKNNQRQLDMDGVEVGVSRQALDELIAAYERLTTVNAEPVAEVVRSPLPGGGYRQDVQWRTNYIPEAGAKLYVAPQASAPVAVQELQWIDTKNIAGGRKIIALDLFHNEFARMDYELDEDATARIEAFKREKQADYDRRIRSALVEGGEVREGRKFVKFTKVERPPLIIGDDDTTPAPADERVVEALRDTMRLAEAEHACLVSWNNSGSGMDYDGIMARARAALKAQEGGR